MNVDAIKGSGSLYTGKAEAKNVQQDSSKSAVQNQDNRRGDKLEISDSARAMSSQPIKKKIEDKFYERAEVQQEVAEKINRELPPPNKQS